MALGRPSYRQMAALEARVAEAEVVVEVEEEVVVAVQRPPALRSQDYWDWHQPPQNRARSCYQPQLFPA